MTFFMFWWVLQSVLELVLFVSIPWGAIAALRELKRSRSLTTRSRNVFLVFGLLAVLLSYVLFIVTLVFLSILGFFATYPSLEFILLNVSLCCVGLFVARLGTNRF